MKYATGLRLGTANAEDILRRFTRNNTQHPRVERSPHSGRRAKRYSCAAIYDSRHYVETENANRSGKEADAASWTVALSVLVPTRVSP